MFIAFLKRNSFFRSFIVLTAGAIVAQSISLLTSPLLTRIFSPQDFGLFSLFLAVVSSFTPILSGKYEVALLLPKSDREGAELFGVASIFCMCFSFLFFIVLYFSESTLGDLFGLRELRNWLFLLPLVFFLTGILNNLIFFANRFREYKIISISRVVGALIGAIFSIIFGLLSFDFGGLVLALILGLGFSILSLLFYEKHKIPPKIFYCGEDKFKAMRKYKEFPLYNASTGVLDGISLAFPVFFISHYFPGEIVGFYALAIRIGSAPFSLFSSSISMINQKKIVDIVNLHKRVQPYLLKLTGILLLIVTIFIITLEFLAPDLFAFIFGEKWVTAGFFLQILLPAIGIKFVASSLSSTIGATNNSRLGMIWKIICFCVTLLVLGYFSPKKDIIILLKAIAIADCLLYILYYLFILYSANYPRNYV